MLAASAGMVASLTCTSHHKSSHHRHVPHFVQTLLMDPHTSTAAGEVRVPETLQSSPDASTCLAGSAPEKLFDILVGNKCTAA